MSKEVIDVDVKLILEALYQHYGYDFRNYSEAHLKRRIRHRMSLSHIHSSVLLRDKILADKDFAAMFLQDLSITVTEMFRDAEFYTSLRKLVFPALKTYSFIKIWHAGCSTGEEVYSMAMMLKEEGLYDRTTIYATDFNQNALDHAKQGIYSFQQIREYTINYQRAGGKGDFSSYYTSNYDMVIMDQALRKNIVWANHNLVTDSVFAEVHLLLCRNVLIYFNSHLQNHVHQLFYESLIPGGFLCLGSKESIRFTDVSDKYTDIEKKYRIFKKRY